MSTRGEGRTWKSHTRENDRRWRREQGSTFWVEERRTFWKRRDGVWGKSDEGGWCKWNWGLETGVHFSTWAPNPAPRETGEERGERLDAAWVVVVDMVMTENAKIARQIYKFPTCSTARSDSTCKRESYSNLSRMMVRLHETENKRKIKGGWEVWKLGWWKTRLEHKQARFSCTTAGTRGATWGDVKGWRREGRLKREDKSWSESKHGGEQRHLCGKSNTTLGQKKWGKGWQGRRIKLVL